MWLLLGGATLVALGACVKQIYSLDAFRNTPRLRDAATLQRILSADEERRMIIAMIRRSTTLSSSSSSSFADVDTVERGQRRDNGGSGGGVEQVVLDYEALRALDDRLPNRRGASDAVVNLLPTRLVPADGRLRFDADDASVPAHAHASNDDSHDDGDHCLVCLERYEGGQSVMTLPCFHYFHDECARKWLAIKSECPTCREQL